MPKFAFQRFLSCDSRPVLFAASVPSSAKQVRCPGSGPSALRSALLFKSDNQGDAGGRDLAGRSAAAAEILNQPLRVFLQMPDKLRIETLDPLHRVVFCRNGQKVWVYPHEILAGIVATGRPERERRIPDFHLPIKDQQIVWIPALFQILRFESGSDATGTPTWILDFQLAPEFAQALKCEPLDGQHDCQTGRLSGASSPDREQHLDRVT